MPRVKKFTINDDDREAFVNNNEGWYERWRTQVKPVFGMRRFVRTYRDEIDADIRAYCGQELNKDEQQSDARLRRRGH